MMTIKLTYGINGIKYNMCIVLEKCTYLHICICMINCVSKRKHFEMNNHRGTGIELYGIYTRNVHTRVLLFI